MMDPVADNEHPREQPAAPPAPQPDLPAPGHPAAPPFGTPTGQPAVPPFGTQAGQPAAPAGSGPAVPPGTQHPDGPAAFPGSQHLGDPVVPPAAMPVAGAPVGPLVPEPPPGGPPPVVRPPTEVTPEQIRQFQDFQRFQALMREQAEKGFPPPANPPPPGFLQPWGQPPKQSLPKRLLKAAVSKIITGLVVLAVLVLAGWWAIDHFLGSDVEDHPTASETGGGKAETNLIFETDPKAAVLKVYDDIAQGDAKSACSRFTDDARAQFAQDMSEYGNSCSEIVMTIHNAVAADRMKAEYADPWIPASAIVTSGTTATVSSCAIEVVGGPRLGLLELSEIPNSEAPAGGAQWIVSGHRTEPADCGGSVSTPPTT
jgi:hypothetical protein